MMAGMHGTATRWLPPRGQGSRDQRDHCAPQKLTSSLKPTAVM